MMLVSVLVFALCGVALVTASVLAGRGSEGASVSGMFDRMLSSRAIRLAVLVVWWWLGWHFLAGQTL